jgi:hypothetical protein
MNKAQPFRQHHITRALRAASAAGVSDPHVRITLPGGGELHVGGGGEVPKAPPKKSAQKDVTLAKGSDTPMHGKGDRTVTAPADSAGKQRPGTTGHKTSSRGGKLAEGGSPQGMVKRQAADSASPERTGKSHDAASAKQASGGLSRPARPGSCGT